MGAGAAGPEALEIQFHTRPAAPPANAASRSASAMAKTCSLSGGLLGGPNGIEQGTPGFGAWN